MNPSFIFSLGAALGLVAVLGVVFYLMLQRCSRAVTEKAREEFRIRREWLEAEFVKQASRSGKPRGLAWADCDFENEVCFARDRVSGELRALVAVTIRFEAIVGGGMEHVEAVSNLRSATAVFLYSHSHWHTDGRAVFNLSPHETIRHFAHELEPVFEQS